MFGCIPTTDEPTDILERYHDSYLTAPDAPDIVRANLLFSLTVVTPPASRQVEQFIFVKSQRKSLREAWVVIAASLAPNPTNTPLNIWQVYIKYTE